VNDEEHHAVTLRYLHGKIAEVMTNDQIRAAASLPRVKRQGPEVVQYQT
jgi:hypothetical protein